MHAGAHSLENTRNSKLACMSGCNKALNRLNKGDSRGNTIGRDASAGRISNVAGEAMGDFWLDLEVHTSTPFSPAFGAPFE